ncbi:MAG: excisionase family DNA-binding protein [Candidatus Liptonbacteria bacterium]|nr:excisionase family DNA-binding protein [Candidatus Liptonbacteria bacterium]
MKQEFLSTTELAKVLGISRIAVFKKIRSGEIEAQKVGRNYAIPKNNVLQAVGAVLGDNKKRQIERAVQRAVAEYGEAFRLLGRE